MSKEVSLKELKGITNDIFKDGYVLFNEIQDLSMKFSSFIDKVSKTYPKAIDIGRSERNFDNFLDLIFYLERIATYVKNNSKPNYYHSEYRRKRHEVFIEQGEICAKCGAIPPVYLQIDHIKPVSKYPELFLEKSNMQVLCVSCNREKSNKHETDYRSKNGLD